MKKLTALLVGALLLPVAVFAAQFEEGKHYEVISEQATAKPEVKEYFSYYCPACFGFEPKVQALAKQLPAGAELKKVHVDFLQQAKPEIQATLAKAYLVGKNLGKGDEISGAFFKHIHVDRKTFASDDDIKAVVVAKGVDAETYDKAIKSFTVAGAAKQMKKEQDTLSARRVLTSVPTFIVNGKYKVLTQGLSRENQDEEFKQLINFLLTQS
ncbi:MAG: thiol:disulfide interchange protein DsbA/DsbL [Gammaproteobacteria bacterium]|nr:thiol:disulfide interchange protein DsbA/DsbL [Gammaproteobacteria bacterium]MBU2056180.1 thiol:disulfide interchange protein DsbA/DsbL [Gammaproteobacteria bacterium]MBU2173924.1 thiol:disulfide interchange protein DsbA/DsbL [Gammaproteobacteria bacterium]MBU2248688.1 thiol:disulfide interchange protein DsbA/DsbL [Gammaproteobacteria bacterium]MBU2344038.1 thiol:disulfide interchange protein DsbA/DsbL [Gammaproteobacteria bacterium]